MRPKEKTILVWPSTVDSKTSVRICYELKGDEPEKPSKTHHPVSRASVLRLERLLNSDKCLNRPMIFDDAIWIYGHWKGIPND